jgi:hypothetical protein
VPQLIWSPEALTDVKRLYRFLAEKTLMLPDVQQAQSVMGCKSLQTIPMLAVPLMTWTQNFKNGRSALAPAGM